MIVKFPDLNQYVISSALGLKEITYLVYSKYHLLTNIYKDLNLN